MTPAITRRSTITKRMRRSFFIGGLDVEEIAIILDHIGAEGNHKTVGEGTKSWSLRGPCRDVALVAPLGLTELAGRGTMPRGGFHAESLGDPSCSDAGLCEGFYSRE